MVIVTHNEQFAKLADRVLRIRDGTVHEEERPQADRPLARVVWSDLSCSDTAHRTGLTDGTGYRHRCGSHGLIDWPRNRT